MRQTLLSLLAARRQGRADLLLAVFSQAEECARADVGQVSILTRPSDLQQTVDSCPSSEGGKLHVPLEQHAISMCLYIITLHRARSGR